MMELGESQWTLLDKKLPNALYNPELVSVNGAAYLLGEIFIWLFMESLMEKFKYLQ